MPSEICLQCDYHRPWKPEGLQCSAFQACVTNNRCGLRTPSLTAAERQQYYGSEGTTTVNSTQEKDWLIIRISKQAAFTGKDLLLQFLDRYGLPNLAQANVEQLREYCNAEGVQVE